MTTRNTSRSALLTLAGGLMLTSATPAGAAEKITFEDHVLPVFEQSCLNCHNPDDQKGGLDLSNYAGTLRGGSGGKIAEAGDGGSSSLFASITHTGENKMPPKGDKIPKTQADLIRAWIDGGLLETKDSTAKKRSGPKIDLAVQVDPNAKPDGPPPMPAHLSLEPVVVAPRSTAVADMAASPWAPLLAITGQKQVLLYHTQTLQLAAVLPFEAGNPEVLSFHPSGKYLLAGGGIPGKSGTTITWDITTGKEVMRNGKAFDSILGASLRLDLGAVASGGPSRLIKLYDTQTGEEAKSVKKHTDWITSMAYSPDGVLLATADRNGGAWVWEAGTANEFHSLRGHQKGINVIRWRADSNLLATASEDGQVWFWEMNNGKVVKKVTAHGGGVLAFDYSRDGHFVTSGRDRKVKVWKPDFNIRKELPTFDEMIVEVAFSNDGQRFFTADWNGTISAWDAEKFEKVGELSANPPRIADRITSLRNSISKLPAQITEAGNKLKAAEAALAAAKATEQNAINRRDETKKAIARNKADSERLQQEWNDLNARHSAIAADRKLHHLALTQSREQLDQHRAAQKKAQEDFASILNPSLDEAGKQLAAEATRWRNEANKKEGDAGLKRRAEEAEKRLQDHQRKLAGNNKEQASAQDRLAQMKKQAEDLQQQVRDAENVWKQTEPEWTKLETRRKVVAERRKQLGPERESLVKSLPNLEKAVKPAQEASAAKQKAIAPLKEALAVTESRESKLQQDLRFWTAAGTNHEALEATTKHLDIKGKQDAALAEFTALSKELTSLREEVAQTTDEALRKTLTARISALTDEIAALRTAIDQRVPLLAKLEQEAKSLHTRYQELLK